MKKILIIILVIILGFLAFRSCAPKPQPPVATPTLTLDATNAPTVAPTHTPVSPTSTAILEPTVTETSVPTATPTITPVATKFTLSVTTGYENGALHFRSGPGLAYLPKWMSGLGAVYEGDQLEFITCADTEYPWVLVIFNEMVGFVYGEYVAPVVCQ